MFGAVLVISVTECTRAPVSGTPLGTIHIFLDATILDEEQQKETRGLKIVLISIKLVGTKSIP